MPESATTASTPAASGYPRYAALATMGLGVAVLLGWATGVAWLKSFVPGLIEMKVNTACAFVLMGGALWLLSGPGTTRGRVLAGRSAAGAVLLLGVASLAEWVFAVDLGIDQLLVVEPASAVYTSAPGRMAPNTAINFICDSLALLLIDWRWRGIRPGQALCVVELVMAMLALLVYVYGVGKVFGLLRFTPMAVHTALGFLVLSTGILWSRSDCGPMTLVVSRSSAGALVRRLLPAVVLVPPLIAWLCLSGIASGAFDTSFAFAAFTVATIILVAVPIWFCARAVFATEQVRQRRLAEAEAHGAEQARLNVELVRANAEAAAAQAAAERARDGLRDLQDSKDLLTGMVIHDLRNPLAASLGYLDLAEAKIREGDDSATQSLERSRAANLRMLEMINSIIDIMRMEDSKMQAHLAPTDITELIAAKLEQYQGAAARAGVTLERRGHGGAAVVTDRALLGRVIDNLIINAIKHTPRGGSIAIEESRGADGRTLTMRVIDTGEGIAQDDLGRLFKKYGRVEGQAMGRQYDTGLGLVFCRMAVDLLGGAISVASELGKGTVFTIALRSEGAPIAPV